MSARRVLVVDDDPDIRDAFETLLAFKGLIVDTADDGDTAVAKLTSARDLPDVVLLDLRMPRMSGEAFLAQIARHPQLRRIPIIILSGDADAAGKVATGRVTGFLRKPPETADLMAAVTRAFDS